jgi:glycosyltransferase involved in cell wall biosynthesis
VSSPLVTVVTPVFNGERHLAECLESVIAQTYPHWTYVVLDNASTDRTAEIVREFAARDDRIHYERFDEFVDVIASHSRAFRAATASDGAYVKVLGADDWLFPECLARMVQVAEDNPSVGVVGAYRLAGRRVDLVGIPFDQTVVSGAEVVARSLTTRDGFRWSVLGSPSALLLRTDVVRARDSFYDSTLRHADTEAGYWALMRSDLGFVHQVLTFSREPEQSESSASNRLASDRPERIRMLLRYGPAALTPVELRAELEAQLDDYLRWYVRYRIRRRSQRDIWAFHRRAVTDIVQEASQAGVESARLRLLERLTRW